MVAPDAREREAAQEAGGAPGAHAPMISRAPVRPAPAPSVTGRHRPSPGVTPTGDPFMTVSNRAWAELLLLSVVWSASFLTTEIVLR